MIVSFFRWSLICLLRRADRVHCVLYFFQKEIRRLVAMICSLGGVISSLINRRNLSSDFVIRSRTLSWWDASGGSEIFVAWSGRGLEGGEILRGGRSAVFGEGLILFLWGFLVRGGVSPFWNARILAVFFS